MTIRLFEKPRDVPIFRPSTSDSLSKIFGVSTCLNDLTYVRVAKLDKEILGGYQMRREADTEFVIDRVRVTSIAQGKGLGGWLLGHALGLAEAKGGRRVSINDDLNVEFYLKHRFAINDKGHLRLELTPE